MRLRTLACLFAAALVAGPAVPAGAEKGTPPASAFVTADKSLLIYSDMVHGRVEGHSTDNDAVSQVMISYCNTRFCQYRFEPNTGPDKRHQTWSFDIPPDGTWQVNVRAIDNEGTMEHPGPEITISVLPLEHPVTLPPLPLLDELLPR